MKQLGYIVELVSGKIGNLKQIVINTFTPPTKYSYNPKKYSPLNNPPQKIDKP